MNEHDNLKKYKSRLKIESLIKSIVYGLIGGCSIVILLSFVLYLFKTKNVLIVILIGLLTTIGCSYYIYNYKFKPTLNTVAKRIDELGLEERVITMVEYKDSDKFINIKQREDTIDKLEKVEAKAIKFKLSKYSFIVLGFVLILSGFTFALPNRGKNNSSSSNLSSGFNSSNVSSVISSSSSSSSEVLDEDAIIQKLLDELRKIINNAKIDQDVKDRLHEYVDELEIELKSLETLDEKIEAINKARDEIKAIIEDELLKMSLGRCLQQFDMTKELGVAIYQEDLEKVDSAITNLVFLLTTSENIKEDTLKLIEYLEWSLNKADKEENEALKEAISNFIASLKAIVGETTSIRIHIMKANQDDDIKQAIIDAGEEIKDALRKSDETQEPEQGEENPDDPQEGETLEDDLEQAGDEMDSALEDAKDQLEDLKDQNKEDEKEEDDNQGNQNGGENNSGNPELPPMFDDTSDSCDNVIDGNTPYLDVLDEYMEQIIALLESGEEIPDELKELVERYLDMIKE